MKLVTSLIILIGISSIHAMELSDLEKQFLHAAAEGKIKIVQNCIDQGVNINVTGKYNETAFYKAINHKKWPVVHLLLDQPLLDVEKNPVSEEPRVATTSMHMLVKSCQTPEHLALIKRVISKKKPNLNVLDGRADTPLLYELATSPNVQVIECLVKAGAAMTADEKKNTPLQQSLSPFPEVAATILHSSHLSFSDLKQCMRECKNYAQKKTNQSYGYRLSFETMKTYYKIMRAFGFVLPKQNEWPIQPRSNLRHASKPDNPPFTLTEAKSIAANVAHARFKMLDDSWSNQ